jgi:uncharacterized protein (TIGR03437 family)
MFNSSAQIERYLFAAIYLARSGAALSKESSPTIGVNDRLNKVDAYLSFCEDLMVSDSIAVATFVKAGQVNARVDVNIGLPAASPAAGTGFMLAASNVAKVMTAASVPFTTQTAFASNGGTNYELGNVTVTINGKAAALLMVSPMQINFTVPADAPGGLADILVTSREGYVFHGSAAVAGLAPAILGWTGDTTAQGAVINPWIPQSGAFSVSSGSLFTPDLRTRLTIMASGISTGVTNTNFGNDVLLPSGALVENVAESVAVEARTSDGRVFMLPVEFAGAQGVVAGLDQVNVVLVPELRGAGSIQLTLVVGAVRSNAMTISVQ